MPRSAEWIAAILGVLKSGAAFLPIDPEHPPALIDKMLRDCGAGFTIGREERIELYPAREPVSAPVNPSHLAYVIYTSGSTGSRKAVAVEHRALVNHTCGIIERFAIAPADRVLQFASPGFDVALEEIFPALLGGCRCHRACREFGDSSSRACSLYAALRGYNCQSSQSLLA